MGVSFPGQDIGQHIRRIVPADTLPIALGGSGGGGLPLSDELQFPRVFVPPDGAQLFTLQDERDTAAVEALDFAATLVVPVNHRAVIRFVQVIGTNADATMAGFSFTVKLDGAPIPGLNSLRLFQLGGNQTTALDTFAPVIGERTLSVGFNNTLGGAHHIGVLVHGWFWAARLEGQ